LTEQDIETAIRNTFGDTTGAPQANQSDFSYTDDLTIPQDTTSPQLASVSTQLAGIQNVFGGLAPDWRSLVSGLSPLYAFTLDFTGFGLGIVTIDLSPFATGIAWVRSLILASITMIIVIKLAKHVGTVL
jgi:hypothetical protein